MSLPACMQLMLDWPVCWPVLEHLERMRLCITDVDLPVCWRLCRQEETGPSGEDGAIWGAAQPFPSVSEMILMTQLMQTLLLYKAHSMILADICFAD